MSSFIDALNMTTTENGAAAYASTGSQCLDLFATIGALREADEYEIISRFTRAFSEDRDTAMKLLFYARDVRGGLGERRAFRVIIRRLADAEPESVIKNIEYIAEFGRYDDLLELLGTACEDAAVELIRRQLRADLAALEGDGQVSLLGKWLPSINASCADTVAKAKKLASALGMNGAEYRKTLSALRARIRIIENDLRTRSYTFDYSKQPSKALFKYRRAFVRNDSERYGKFIADVAQGKATMHTGTLMPYEVIAPCLEYRALTKQERAAINATWESLEDFTHGENALAIVDGSGSMYGGIGVKPALVAQSLGLYFAERNKGAFNGYFITFSEHPKLVKVCGDDICSRVRHSMSYNECANTDLEAVFRLILDAAVKSHMSREDMPSALYIISDMEFDFCARNADATVFESAKEEFAEHGYELPQVIFWNVNSRTTQQPVTMNEQGVALVSGCSPRVFSMVTSGRISPLEFMTDALSAERYARISA